MSSRRLAMILGFLMAKKGSRISVGLTGAACPLRDGVLGQGRSFTTLLTFIYICYYLLPLATWLSTGDLLCYSDHSPKEPVLIWCYETCIITPLRDTRNKLGGRGVWQKPPLSFMHRKFRCDPTLSLEEGIFLQNLSPFWLIPCTGRQFRT